MTKTLLTFLLSLGLFTCSIAQKLTVSIPIDGAVYQQNSNHQGKIIVRGDLNTKYMLIGGYVVSASLQKLDLVNGNPTGAAPISIPISRSKTVFNGSVMVEKGWYELTVKATQITTFPLIKRNYETKRKVGVGEVFVIAGQSNAQGGFGLTASNTQRMDAVRVSPDVIPEANLGSYDPNDPKLPSSYREIQRLVGTKDHFGGIGPTGGSLWYWASLGAKLANECQAPVAFFNAGYGGTTVTQWISSTNPNARASSQTNSSDITFRRYPAGSPFYFFANMLKFYANAYGVRAVLWMQGETDTKAYRDATSGELGERESWSDRVLLDKNFNPLPSAPFGNGSNEKRWVRDAGDYRQKLAEVIKKSREFYSGPAVPWVVAQTSYIYDYTPNRNYHSSSVVRDGQNANDLNARLASVGAPGNVYTGPYTDDLGTNFRRPAGSGADEPVHFNNDGLNVVADRWFDKLKTVCENTFPVTVQDLGTEPQGVDISDDGRTVSAPGGYSNYTWSTDNGSSTNADAPVCNVQTLPGQCVGTHRAIMQNDRGNYVITQTVDFPYTIVDDTNDGSTGSAPLATGCYTLKAKHSNKFLQVADGNAGTRIRQQDGNGSTNQIFKLEVVDGSLYRMISQFSNKVMDANGAGTGSGTTVNQHDWANSAQQKWRLEAYGDGTYKLVPSYSSALAADVEGPSQDNGAGLHLWSPHGGDSQRFYVQASGCSGGTTPPPTNPPTGSLSGCYVIRSVQTNQLMEAISGNTVEQRGANGANNQIWKAETTSANQYRFVTQNGSGLAMSVNDLNNGELLRLSASSGDNRQLWTIQDNGSGAYRINGSNGVTWDMKNYGNDPQLQLWGSTSEGFQNQRLFRFESTGCPGGTTNPPTNPPSGGSLTIVTPTYNCNTGNLTINTSGGNGSTIEYQIPGVAAWTTNSTFAIPSWQRTGTTFTLQVRQSGTQANSYAFLTTCDGGTPNPPTNPPTGGGTLTIVTPTYNCNTGNLTIATSGGNGTTLEYQVPGLAAWTTNSTFTVPSWQRTGTTFTIQVRQSGTEASPYSFLTACSGGRLSAISSSEPAERLRVNPNPTDGLTRVRFTLDKGKEATLSVVAVDGRTVYAKPVAGTGHEQAVSIDLSQQADGLYLIRLANDTMNQTAKLLLQH
ncbi:RICIN domain-containing protein [Larkinella sp.]|uniref:RICIN domain-containing protein n=1 Tax=Larkinella sp. TaxID=2034517 RepID=UPI003BAB73E2